MTITLKEYLDYIMDYAARNALSHDSRTVKEKVNKQLAVVGVTKVEYVDEYRMLLHVPIKDLK